LHSVATDDFPIDRAPGNLGGSSFLGSKASFLCGTLGLLGVAGRSRVPFASSRDGDVGVDIVKANRLPEER
jgi:hypothetical protein